MPTLKVILGPTAVGKTDYSIDLALRLRCPIISCDSRQIFRGMAIGTAQPSKEQLEKVRHYFIACKNPDEHYTAGLFEIEALNLLEKLFKEYDTIVMAGGSGLYVDALCNGLDNFPAADLELRERLTARVKEEGLSTLRRELQILDPESYATIDIANPQRVVRALEVTLATGRKFSEFKTNTVRKRWFDIEKHCLTRPREELYERIDARVDAMFEAGLVEEVRSLTPYRNMLALNTVGYREVFSYLDGETDIKEVLRLIKRNTRHYAKRQITYWARDPQIEYVTLPTRSSL